MDQTNICRALVTPDVNGSSLGWKPQLDRLDCVVSSVIRHVYELPACAKVFEDDILK